MQKKNLRGITLLFVAAFIWGTAFVAQSVGSGHVGTFTFNFTRSVVAVVVLIPVAVFLDKKNTESIYEKRHKNNKLLFSGGIICGIMLCTASNFQQLGVMHSTVGKSAFITSLYIIIVPILGMFNGKRVAAKLWISVVISLIGLYLLCMNNEAFYLSVGDIYLLLCAVFFSFQIIAVDYYSPKVNGIKLSIIQFAVTAVISGILMVIFERMDVNCIIKAIVPILYAGAMSSGVAYTLQIIAQKDVNSTAASLVMGLESVIASLAGWILLGQILSPKEVAGCILVFSAVILAQLPSINLKKING